MPTNNTNASRQGPPAPLLPAARLWQKTSAKGAVYFTGRWGNLKVVILENRDRAENGIESHTHTLFLTEAAPREGGGR